MGLKTIYYDGFYANPPEKTIETRRVIDLSFFSFFTSIFKNPQFLTEIALQFNSLINITLIIMTSILILNIIITTMADTMNKLVYSFVARGNKTLLSSFSPYRGNFQTSSLQVLRRLNFNKTIAQFATANYKFYSLIQNNFVFRVMAGSDYQVRIAVDYLRDVRDKFFQRYSQQRRENANAHSLKEFDLILADRLKLFKDPQQVDKFTKIQKKMNQIQQISLKNIDKTLDNMMKIEVLVQKTKDMEKGSYDILSNARTLKRKLWWKNKKIIVGIILLILLLIFIIVWSTCQRCK